jgi:type 1 fimbria pilin
MRKMRKMLLAGVVAAALAVPAPAFAIHDGVMPFVGNCTDNPGNSQAIGSPATGHANTGHVNTDVLGPLFSTKEPPPCHFS